MPSAATAAALAGLPTRAEYIADHGRAQRAKTDPDTARQAAALGVPLLEEDDGAFGPAQEDPIQQRAAPARQPVKV